MSLVGGLFWADSIGQILQTEFNSRLWWDLRNGQTGILDSDNALYGWRTGWFTNVALLTNTVQFYSDGGIVTGLGSQATNRYPTLLLRQADEILRPRWRHGRLPPPMIINCFPPMPCGAPTAA